MSNVTVIRGKGPRPEMEENGAREKLQRGLDKLNAMPTNVSMAERHLSLTLGGLVAGLAIGRRSALTSGILGSLGAYLVARGATGHCYLYETMGMQACDEEGIGCSMDEMRSRNIEQHEHDDIVDEASEASMVASDPPAYTPTTGTGGQ